MAGSISRTRASKRPDRSVGGAIRTIAAFSLGASDMADGKGVSDTVTAPASRHDAEPSSAAAPLFRFDPGWMFVLAGLAVCVAGVLLPAQADLHALRQQLGELKSEEARWYSRLKAHGDFLDQIDRGDADLVRRLAASQLNVIPSNETPVLLAPAGSPPLTQWIDNTVKPERTPVSTLPISSLSRLANGPDRLWLFAGGIMCVFIGLLMGPGLVRPKAKESAADVAIESADDDSVVYSAADSREPEQSATRTVLVQVESDDDELLTEDQVFSNVLVEVPPASRTMENKELSESAATAMSSTSEVIGTPVEPLETVKFHPTSTTEQVVGDGDKTDSEDVETNAPATRTRRAAPQGPSNDDADQHRSPLVEASDDAEDGDDEDHEDWPTARQSHRSNRFEDSDEPQERSSRD
jgi:hypothetical protein